MDFLKARLPNSKRFFGWLAAALGLCALPFSASADQDSLNSSLRQVARLGQLGEVQKLLAEGADVDAMAPYGETALQYAALYGHTQVVRSLIAAGAKIDHRDYEGNTPLIVAAHNCNPRTVATLLSLGARPNLENHQGTTALIYATDQGCTKTVRVLLASKGIDVRHRDDWDKNAFDYARENALDYGFYEPEMLIRLRGRASKGAAEPPRTPPQSLP